MNGYYNWMETETFFVDAATDKQVLKKMSTSLVRYSLV